MPKRKNAIQSDEQIEEHKQSIKEKRGKAQADKKENNDNSNFMVIKMKWNRFCALEPMKDIIPILVQKMSQVSLEAYYLINLHLLDLMSQLKNVNDEFWIQYDNTQDDKFKKKLKQKSKFLDQTFYRRCCNIILANSDKSDIMNKDPDLFNTYQEYKVLRNLQKYVPIESGGLVRCIEILAGKMVTMVQNHIVLNFPNRLIKYIQLKYKIEKKKDAQKFLRDTFYSEEFSEQQQELKDWLKIYPHDWAIKKYFDHFICLSYDILQLIEEKFYKQKLLRENTELEKFIENLFVFEDDEPIDESNLTKRQLKRKRTKKIQKKKKKNRIIKNINKQIKVKLFSILPHKQNFIQSHISIDNHGFAELLQYIITVENQKNRITKNVYAQKNQQTLDVLQNAPITSLNEKNNYCILGQQSIAQKQEIYKNHKDIFWNQLFDWSKITKVTKKWTFDSYIETDGYTVSIRYRSPKPVIGSEPLKKRTKKQEPLGDYDLLISIDPGKTYLCTAFTNHQIQGSNKKYKKNIQQFSTAHYRNESKMTKHQNYIKKFRKKNPEYATICQNMLTLKTSSIINLKQAICYGLTHCAYLFETSRNSQHLKWRFTLFIESKRVLHRFAKELVGTAKNPCIGFGDWSKQNTGILKGSPTAPVKKFKKILEQRGYKVIEIDEYKTSITCSLCKSYCPKVYYPHIIEGTIQNIQCHEVVRCSNSECNTYWQRDVNAARNILGLLEHLLVHGSSSRPNPFSRSSQIKFAL